MVSKLISAAISFFRLRLRQAAQKGFHRNSITVSNLFAYLPRLAGKTEISRRKSFETISKYNNQDTRDKQIQILKLFV